MSLETYSKVRNRTYKRAFDHDEARRLHDEGWTYSQLARHFGVTEVAVSRVLDPKVRERMDQSSREWFRKNKAPCKGGCGRSVYMVGSQEALEREGRTGYCRECAGLQKTKSSVRENELRCTKCGMWKPDDEFGRESDAAKGRRGHRAWCRNCETKSRRDLRRKNRELERVKSRAYKRKKPRKKGSHRMANYTVLKMNGDNAWKEIGKVAAGSRLHAIEEITQEAGSYIAVSETQMVALRVEPVMSLRVVSNSENQEAGEAETQVLNSSE